MIRPSQLDRAWIIGRAFRAGRGKGVLAQELEPCKGWAGVPRYFFREAAAAALRFAATRALGDAPGAFRAAWAWNYALGCIAGAWSAASTAGAGASPHFADAPSLPVPAPG